ncbi:unnamed protein product, partial [Chrysoparadoxa australica]
MVADSIDHVGLHNVVPSSYVSWFSSMPYQALMVLALPLMKVLGLYRTPQLPSTDLSSKVIIVTGSNAGIGKSTAQALSGMGATVVLACRSEERANEAKNDIVEALKSQGKPPGPLEFISLNLQDLDSVRKFAQLFKSKYKRLDVLVNNAGISGFQRGASSKLTKDGLPWTIGVNFIGHFLLTLELMDVIKVTPGSRVVNLSSVLHRFGRSHTRWMDKQPASIGVRYCDSKLAMVMLTVELRRRFEAEGLDCYSFAVHPGVVRTSIWRQTPRIIMPIYDMFMRAMYLSSDQGSYPSVNAAAAPLDDLKQLLGPKGADKAALPLYLQPYLLPFDLALPFEWGGPFVGCSASR